MATRKPYPSDVSDDEWAFVAPYLTLMTEDAPQRDHSLREVFNALRFLVRTGSPWRYLPNDLPPWYTVYQQTMRWIKAGCFEAMAANCSGAAKLGLPGTRRLPKARSLLWLSTTGRLRPR